jgi:nonsense-mediated mRNA decay protein 3
MTKNLLTPPEYLSVEVCQSCWKVMDGSIWRDMAHEDVAASTLEKETRKYQEVEDLRWEVPDFDPEKGEHRVPCRAYFTVAGHSLELEFDVGIRVRYQKCPSCSRQSGDYYEAIIQLRQEGIGIKSAEIELAEENAMLFKMVDEHSGSDENAFVTKFSAVKGGMDFYMGSSALARAIANKFRNRFGASVNESPSLVGMKDGRDLYRYSILVRLPSFRDGDVVAFNKKLHLVESNDGKNLALKNILNGQIIRVPSDDSLLRMVAKHTEVMEAVVVTHDRSTIQVLDPSSMAAVTITKPSYMKKIGEIVHVIRYDDSLYAV